MILFFDTTGDRYSIALATREGSIVCEKKFVRDDRAGNKFFRAVVALLGKKKCAGVVVVIGPGRFSGIRHGVAIANTLGFAWGIPVAGVEADGGTVERLHRGVQLLKRKMISVVPLYGKEPNIT